MTSNTPAPDTSRELSAKERRDRNKVLLLDALKAIGAVRATVDYSGSGDEGFADETSAVNADQVAIDLSNQVPLLVERSHFVDGQWQSATVNEYLPLKDALRDFAMEAVNELHGGWENNDGGSGKVVFDCAANAVRIEHYSYYTESDYTETAL
jgi:hypothetical protein